MKKNYFMLAAVATLFAACAETDVLVDVSEKESAPQAIGFDAFANKTTRAEITSKDILKNQGYGFKVWGYKYPSTDQNIIWNDVKDGDVITTSKNYFTVFDGVDVTWRAATEGVAAHWGYDNTQYWDETATYNFYAVAPADEASSISNGKIIIRDVASAHANDSKDYLIDRAGNTNIAGSAKAVQSFDFNHIMAKLSFVLKADENINEKITVTSLKMTGWNDAEGTFTQTLTETPVRTISAEEWELETPSVSGEFEIVSSNLEISQAGVDVGNKYIVVPQTINYTTEQDNSGNVTSESGLTFTISYTIADEEFNNQVGVITANQIWGTDTHTTYTITVGPAAIKFDVNSVAGFQASTGSTTIQ